MKALVYERSVSRYVASNVVSRLTGGPAASVSPVRLKDIDPPVAPSPSWHVVRPLLSGICGSDIQAVSGHSSRYFEGIQSFPFVLGHEVVGKLDNGTRVIVEPALGCATRGIDPPCPSCAQGFAATCHNVAFGDIDPGLQTGYCHSTGGGWSEQFLAHESQLHTVPDSISDAAAVMVEPAACAVHAVTGRADVDGALVAVIGAGTLGLLTVAALEHLADAGSVIVGAKHAHQRKLAIELGASAVAPPHGLIDAVRLSSGSLMLGRHLAGGADVVFDCVGSAASLSTALRTVRPGGRIVLVGMPASVSVDLAPLWQREVELAGSYCYGERNGERDFEVAMQLVQDAELERLVSARYPVTRFRDAMEHAANAGATGAVKIVFDLRNRP